MSANECLTQVTDVIVRYERMVERLRTAGRLPRNPKEKEEVGMLLNEVLFFEIM
jgi:nitrogen fixation/metabolism regulation signal transduction histidine kinase